MKLNLYYILDYLDERIICHKIRTPNYTGNLEGVLIYDASLPLDPSCLYLIDGKTWQEQGNDFSEGSFLISDYQKETPAPEGVEWIGLEASANPIILLNKIQRIFRMFQEWEIALYELMSQNAPLSKFGDATLPYLTNPICLYSAGLQNIFFSERKKPKQLRIFQNGDEMQYLADDEIAGLRLDPDFIKSVDAVIPGMFPDEFFGYRILFDNLRVNGLYIARIMVLEVDRPIRQSDCAILRRLAEILLAVIVRMELNINSHPQNLDKHIIGLIEKESIGESEMEEVLTPLFWKPSDTYFCVLIPTSKYDKAINTVSTLFIKLESSISESVAIPYQTNIFLLVNLTRSTSDREAILSNLAYLLRENLLKAGISITFRNLWQLSDYYDQAESALYMGSILDPTQWLYRFENYALHHLLLHARGGHCIESLCPTGLQALMKYDEKHNRQYTQSLRVYLEENMSVTAAIRRLFIQRSTFLYQLKRIYEISGLDLDDHKVRFQLLLVFQIMDEPFS